MENRYIGLRFGKLTVVSIADDKVYIKLGIHRRLKRYNVVCDCGNITIVFGQDLRSMKTRSCGSSGCRVNGFEDRSLSAFNRLYSRYKLSAITRGLLFDIDVNTFRVITKKECYYCGVKDYSTSKEKNSIYTYNGIDRVNNAIGYIPDNIVTCCDKCNHAKHTMSHDEYIALCKKVAVKHT